MPNGHDVLQGAPVCALCWYFKDDRCTIRGVPIRERQDTLCLNQQAFMPDGNETAVGPVLWHLIDLHLRKWKPEPENVWEPSPDTEEVRLELLRLLENVDRVNSRAWLASPIGPVIIWQLIEFQEQRAVPVLKRLIERHPEAALFKNALEELMTTQED